ncbi:MAG TPA: DUF4126 domain-containing protein, partial [Verrucomicrobiales bacterium]|nr:DUF4126 domain-containing protein [Verrucomicrobiales bacterium]
METILSVFVGLGLAAAAGFRVFVPLLVVALAARIGVLELSPEFAWVGSWQAVVAFSAASIIELAAYYIPFVDNFLDGITSPLAVIAGTVLTAAVVTDVDPFFKWTMAIIAGGGMAGMVQAKTVVTRGISSATTAGFANPVVSTVEFAGAATTAAVSVLVPAVALVLVFAVLVWMLR